VLLSGWIAVLTLARRVATAHPESGPFREVGSGCGGGCGDCSSHCEEAPAQAPGRC
jgi:hypothetical protein